MEITPVVIGIFVFISLLPIFLILKFGTIPKNCKIFKINFGIDVNIDFSLETNFSRLMYKLKINSKVESFAPAFDKKYKIVIPNPKFTLALIKNDEFRKVIEELFNLGVTSISTCKSHQQRDSMITAQLNPKLSEQLDLYREELTSKLQRLGEIINNLLKQGIDVDDPRWQLKLTCAYLFTAIIFALLLTLDLSSIGSLVDPNQIWPEVVALLLILLSSLSILNYFIIRGFPNSQLHLIISIISVFVTMIQAGEGVQNFINNNLDYSQPKFYEVIVSNKREIDRKKGADSYFLYFSPILEGKLDRVQVKYYQYNKVEEHRSKIRLAVYPGTLEATWIKVVAIDNQTKFLD